MFGPYGERLFVCRNEHPFSVAAMDSCTYCGIIWEETPTAAFNFWIKLQRVMAERESGEPVKTPTGTGSVNPHNWWFQCCQCGYVTTEGEFCQNPECEAQSKPHMMCCTAGGGCTFWLVDPLVASNANADMELTVLYFSVVVEAIRKVLPPKEGQRLSSSEILITYTRECKQGTRVPMNYHPKVV